MQIRHRPGAESAGRWTSRARRAAAGIRQPSLRHRHAAARVNDVRFRAGSLPSAVNAVLDALASRGVTHLDLPRTPARVWAALAKTMIKGVRLTS